MKPATLALPALALIAAACGSPTTKSVANGTAPANQAQANTTAAGGNMAADGGGALSAYVGHLPSDDVAGVTFLANPLVRSAVEAAVSNADARRWVLRPDVTSNPIGMRDGRIVATGCESHNCGPHHWSILIDPAGTSAEVCYAMNSTLERSTWYVAGRPAEERPGDCPNAS